MNALCYVFLVIFVNGKIFSDTLASSCKMLSEGNEIL